MSPKEIKAILASLGRGAFKALGQHFLVDPSALDAVVQAGTILPGDVVLEIGPGLGVLTRALTEAQAEVYAIEQDRQLLGLLSLPGLHGVYGDAASLDWEAVLPNDRPWKLIANLPYSITSFVLRKALTAPKLPSRIVVLVQREVAERAISVAGEGKGKTSLLSLMVALGSVSARIVRHVPPHAFYPPPKVDSAILEIIPRLWSDREALWGMDSERIMQIAKKGFAHPRKQLVSNLETTKAVLEACGLRPDVRAEDVSPASWALLARTLS